MRSFGRPDALSRFKSSYTREGCPVAAAFGRSRLFNKYVLPKDQLEGLRGELMKDEKTRLACPAEIEYQSWPCLVEATWTRT